MVRWAIRVKLSPLQFVSSLRLSFLSLKVTSLQSYSSCTQIDGAMLFVLPATWYGIVKYCWVRSNNCCSQTWAQAIHARTARVENWWNAQTNRWGRRPLETGFSTVVAIFNTFVCALCVQVQTEVMQKWAKVRRGVIEFFCPILYFIFFSSADWCHF